MLKPPPMDSFEFKEIAKWMQTICALSQYLQTAAISSGELNALYKVWRQEAFSNMASYSEIRLASLPDGRSVQYTFHMHIFTELSRIHWQLMNQAHAREIGILNTISPESVTAENYETLYCLHYTRNPMWIDIRASYIEAALSKGEDETDVNARQLNDKLIELWNTPIVKFNQSQAYALLLFLTQQMICDEEFMKVHRLLWKRIAELCLYTHDGTVLDMGNMRQEVQPGEFSHNRLFLAFCSFYIIQIDRRVFWTQLLRQMQHIQESNLEQITSYFMNWFSREVELMSADNFESVIQNVVDEAYDFPGDERWFKFQWPTNVYNRGACITALRPHLYSQYYSETYLTKTAMIRAAKTQHPARLFVLKTVEQLLQRYNTDLRWCDGVKINNDEIESQDWKMTERVCPLLIQTMANYWLYWDDHVFETEDIFQSIALWFWIVKRDCGSELFKYDLSETINQIFPREQVISTSGNNKTLLI